MLIDKIRQDFQHMRSDHASMKARHLSTLLAEAERVGKDAGNRQPTDEEVQKVVETFCKNVRSNIDVLKGNDKMEAVISGFQEELELYEAYLPEQLTEGKLSSIISGIIANLEDKSPQAMGTVMSELKKNYAGCYDGKQASEITKRLLQNESSST